MKRLFTLLLISFAALSCEMTDENIDDLLDKRDWVIFAEGTELSVNVPSKQTVLNYKFESILDWEVKTDAEWLEIGPMKGKAGKDIKIQIKVLHNKDKEGRTGYVDLTLSNDESYRITINQAGENDENDEGDENEGTIVDVPSNQIWYTSVDGEVVEPYSGEYNEYAEAITTFGVNIVSNTYVDGKGIIEFEGDVTIIGYCAFYNCDSLTSVTIPDSVTTIGYSAFRDCSSLTSATIGDSVTAIGEMAFALCDSLTSVTIGDSVTTIGEAAFVGCSSLHEFKSKFASEDGRCLIIDGTLNSFAPAGLTEYTIPDSVTTIGGYAFGYCSNLTSVTIPDSVTEIGRGAFGGCENLEAVHITDLVSWCNIDFINPLTDGRVDLSANPLCCAQNLYLNGELVTDLVIPDGVNEIKFMAFALCESIKSVTIGNSVTTIGDWVFYNCTSLTSVTIGDSVTTIGYAAFHNCWSLTSVTIPDSVTTIGDYAFIGCSSLASVTIGDSVTTIGDGAFWGCWSLTSVTIPDSVTTIGDRAFYYCSSLTSVFCKAINPPTTIVNNNGYWYGFAKEDESGNICNIDCTIYVPAESVEAYKNADGWNEYADRIVADTSTSIIRYTTIDGNPITPNNNMAVKSNTYINGEGILEFYGNIIGDWAFAYCASLESVTIGDSVTTIGDAAFYNCASLTSVTIPDSVTTIGDWAFADCASLESVTIGDSVTTIGDGAFHYCTSLTSVTIPDSVTKIGNYAFYFCYSLTSITIPDSVISVGEAAFAGCSSLTSVTISDSVTTIGEGAFSGCGSLTSVTIPDSVTTIGEGAFVGCSSLQEFNGKFASEDGRCLIMNGVLNAFAPAGLTEYTIPDSVTTIGNYAFQSCSSLTSVTIPDSVTTIGYAAFVYCENLKTVYCKAINPPTTIVNNNGYWYGFAKEDESGNICNIDCTIYVPTESVEAYKSSQGWSEYADAIVGYNFETGEVDDTEEPELSEYVIEYTSTDGDIVVPYDIMAFDATIVSNVYKNGKGMLCFDREVTTIGDYAFSNCYSLRSVTIPDSVTTIGRGAFLGCSDLKEFKGKFASNDGRVLIVDKVLKSVAPAAGLTEYTIPDIVTTIGHCAFFECSSLTSVTIPDSVTTIGDGAFAYCGSLTSVTIPDSVTVIGEAAFFDCWCLTSVTIGDSVTEIGGAAFYRCSSLTSVYCERTTPPAGGFEMFYKNASGRKIYVPMESVEAYKSAEEWSEYADAIVGYNF